MAKTFDGRWQVVEDLGEGGQGWTHLVRDIEAPDGPLRVLKRLKNAKRIDRFVREVKVIETIDSPHVLHIIDHNVSSSSPYLVTEYCSGGSLLDAYKTSVPTLTESLKHFDQVCDGVRAAHQEGVVHRDLKPANIFLRSQGGPAVVGDFGICFLSDDDEERMTMTEEAVGPRNFMAPELEDGRLEQITAKADSYSLGKLLYWMVSKGRVFSREKHRDDRWDLRWPDLDTITGFRHPYLEHINVVLDLVIHPDPEMRRDVSNLQILVRQAGGLIKDKRQPLTSGMRHLCQFCGKGFYKHHTHGPNNSTSVRNFGFVPVGTAEWRIFTCSHCGHVAAFRPDLSERREPFGDGT